MPSQLPPSIGEALDGYARRLRARFGPRLERVVLFGSWSRGQARLDSDIDVAVIVAGLTRDEWRDAIDDACAVEADTGVILAPLVMSMTDGVAL